MKQLLVVVDYQNDFVNGALGFTGAELLEPGITKAVEETLAQGGYVLFTRDTHEDDYLQTREGQYLPVPHCINGTTGHQLFGGLHRYEASPLPHVALLDKPTFGSPNIAQSAVALCGGAPTNITVCGVVTDICVIANTIALHTAFTNASIAVNTALVGSGNPQNAQSALNILLGMGIQPN